MQNRTYIISLLLITLLIILTSCSSVERSNFSYQVMGTELVVTIESDKPEASNEIAELAHSEVKRLNDLLSVWDPESPFSKLNEYARGGWTDTDEETYSLIQESLKYAELTGGRYDVTAGPLIRLWGFFAKEERKPPTREKIEKALLNVGYQKITFDDMIFGLKYQKPDMEMDLGGIAKGYAVDKAMQLVKDQGVEAALINLGGNISFTGLPKGKDSWGIAVRDPRSSTEYLGVLTLGKEFDSWGIASSGQYERFFIHEGKRYGHIIDPTTGYPVENVLGTTIIASDATRADALSTSAFLLGEGAAEEMINDQQEVFGMVILQKGESGMTIRISKKISDKFTLLANDGEIEIVEF